MFHNFDAVSSLVDFYGYRGKGESSIDELEGQLADEIRRKLGAHWRSDRVLAYVQRHEFEGLLFSNVETFADAINAPEQTVAAPRRIRTGFATPEEINDDRETAPSKRIKSVLSSYHKVRHGLLIAQATGIDVMPAECPRFSGWVKEAGIAGNAVTAEVILPSC